MQQQSLTQARACVLITAALAYGVFAAGSPANAQQAQNPAAAPGRPTVVTHVDEVALDFVARDKKGERIADLEAEDLEILDGGERVQIKELRRVTSAEVILLFDQLEPGNAKNARDAAFEILKATADSDIRFTVLKIDLRLRMMLSATKDREAVKNAVTAATVANAAEYGRQNIAAENGLVEASKGGPRQESATALLAMLLDSQETARDPHMTPSVAGLLALCKAKGASPGRKVVVYFAQGLLWNTSAPETLRAIADGANRARISIYSLDAHVIDTNSANELQASSAIAKAGAMPNTGILGGASGGAGPAGAPSAAGAGISTRVAEQMGRFEQGDLNLAKSPLEAICRSTGGLREVAGNARKSTRLMIEDLTSYYVASYTPPALSDEGRFRPVSVKPSHSGINIQARAGYFASARVARPLAVASEARLLEALTTPNPPRDLPFSVSLLRFGEAEGGNLGAIVFEAPLSGLPLKQDATAKSYSAHLSFLGQVKDKSGAVVERISEELSRQGPLEEIDQAKTDVLALRRHLNLAPGEYVLQAAVLDDASGKLGAQSAKVTIPAKVGGAGLSDIALVRRVIPFAGDEDVDRTDPLRCADGRVMPKLSGRVSKAADKTVSLFFHVFPDRGSQEKPQLKAEVRLNGALIGTVPLPLNQSSEKESVPYIAQLGTANLEPGAYTMTVILQQGMQRASQNITFVLE